MKEKRKKEGKEEIKKIEKKNIKKKIKRGVKREIRKEIRIKKIEDKEKADLEKAGVEKANIEKIAFSLNQHERAVLPFVIANKSVEEIVENTKLLKEAVKRALMFLSNKGVITLKFFAEDIVDLAENGILYLKNGLPERRLAELLRDEKDMEIEIDKAKEIMKDELAISIGELKKNKLLVLSDKKIKLLSKEGIANKFPSEKLLETLPRPFSSLNETEKRVVKELQRRKDIIKIVKKTGLEYETSPIAKKVFNYIETTKQNFIEQITPEVIIKELWKGKKFRYYDVTSKTPSIYGGKRHFVNQAIDYARKIWIEMGFKEMKSNLVDTCFWNFDALFTPQDHPARELQDTFYVKGKKGKIPEKIANNVKIAHEKGIANSSGWKYVWSKEEAERVILRTHTTCISAHTLASLISLSSLTSLSSLSSLASPASLASHASKQKAKQKLIKEKYFAIGKCFRNETVDWNHLFEFNQTEGIVVDENANFRHLLGYLKVFFEKMGFGKVKFYPSYFPYTEPSVEIYAYNEAKKTWIEVGGAGIFRPEVVTPLLGKFVPVLAWGPGFDRALIKYYNINDIRELYENNLTQLREMKFWMK